MSDRNFMDLLSSRWDEGKFVCVGLDSEWDRMPGERRDKWSPCYKGIEEGLFEFNKAIIDATADLVCAYKPNLAFYLRWGDLGINALRETVRYILGLQPEIPVVLDAKDADIGNTNLGYVDFAFRRVTRYVERVENGKKRTVTLRGADAVTVHPYLGVEAMEPFLANPNKGVIVLCRTSNPGAGEFQDAEVDIGEKQAADWGLSRREVRIEHDTDLVTWPRMPLYQLVAHRVAKHWNYNGNCALVVGATYPDELAEVRKIVGDMPILIPGIGAQGGELEATVLAGANDRGQGMIINSSRGIIFASDGEDFAEAARAATQKLHDDITAVLTAA